MEMTKVTLDDKYLLQDGTAYMTGTQALVRLPLLQHDRDIAAGLKTGAFISGYRGSPLGGYDLALHKARKLLAENNVHFVPGLNEDLAATSVWGSQQVGLFPGATVDGVFGIWYGKGPGADRTGDVFKHANGAGTSRHGGVLAVVGDDHGCHSSTMPHQSEHVFQGAMIPIVAPATLQDYIDLGLISFAMSRYCGSWVGFKCVGQTVETAGTVLLNPARPQIVIPDLDLPEGATNIRLKETPMEQEARLHGVRQVALQAFAKANALDRMEWAPARARVGLAASGKAWLDLVEALEDLGIGAAEAERLGIRLYKIGLVWPLEETRLRAFADGLEEIIVIEEKRGLIEDQMTRLLYNTPSRPRIIGKSTIDGAEMFPVRGEITPLMVAGKLGERLRQLYADLPDPIVQRLARLDQTSAEIDRPVPEVIRAPFFCAGCPHNTSTKLPDGSRAMAGIGCHGMAAYRPELRTHLWSHMGGEGLAWVGQTPFTSEKHVFQNLGDGTYSHSGLLAIRAAAAAGVNITYKILYNDAVAMTGGQEVEGGLTVPQMCRQVLAEGAGKVVIVTDEPGKYKGVALPAGIPVRDRSELDAVQRELRETGGLTILIYDQTCAAEKRRRRKRGTFPDPDRRIFINPDVCENCGDCSAKSGCIAIQPVETALGRKRRIDQSSCNKDFSCINGFCPSFVDVEGGTLRKAGGTAEMAGLDDLPDPQVAPYEQLYSVLVTGIGGTGVITIGALLGMAARLDGKYCTVLDATGMAQKNGAVMSHIRIADTPFENTSRIPAQASDLILACDLVVAGSPGAMQTIRNGRTRVVANGDVVPTASFVLDRDAPLGRDTFIDEIRRAAGAAALDILPAHDIAVALMGDGIYTNAFMLGRAMQLGLLPVSMAALRRAIEMNGVAVEANLKAFDLGRLAVIDPKAVTAMAGDIAKDRLPETLDEIVTHRSGLLTEYQNAAYAKRYRALIDRLRTAEERATPGETAVTRAVALNLAKLMAYKDEYEVARLYSDGTFRRRLAEVFEDGAKISIHMAPPLLSGRNPTTGEPRKRKFGPWILPVLGGLAKFKGLRGTPLDPFGYSADRRLERDLIARYGEDVELIASQLSAGTRDWALALASWPEAVRGFGPVKERSAQTMLARRKGLRDAPGVLPQQSVATG